MIDQWSQIVSEAEPSGPSLEYDPRFQALLSASQGRGEQQLGSSILPAQDPDWHFLESEATKLLNESRDIRLLVIWIYASLKLSGFESLAIGIETIAGLLSSQWDTVHPAIEDDGDWYMRSNAIAGLVDPDTVLRALRQLDAATSRVISVNIRDVCLLAEGQQPDACAVNSFEQFQKIVGDTQDICLVRTQVCSRILAGINTIYSSFASRFNEEARPPLEPLQRIIQVLHKLYSASTPAEASSEGASAPISLDNDSVENSAPPEKAFDASVPVRSRNDALKALALAREYFERHEPANPAPLLIQRAERLANSSFLDIIEEMAPDSLGHVKMLTGLNH